MTQSANEKEIARRIAREFPLLINYVLAGKGADQVDRFLDCCNQFRNGRLGDVLTHDEVIRRAAAARGGRSYQEILSQEIAVLPNLTRKFMVWCEQHGIRYVGELARVRWDRNSTMVEASVVSRQLLAHEGILPELNLNAVKWIPFYAEDTRIQEVWAMTRSTFAQSAEMTRGWSYDYRVPDSAHWMFQLFCDPVVSPRFLELRTKLFAEYSEYPLRAGMWVPESYVAQHSADAIDSDWVVFLATSRR